MAVLGDVVNRILVAIESSGPGLVPAVPGLATLLEGRATVFVPLAAVHPEARTAPQPPSVVVVGVGIAAGGGGATEAATAAVGPDVAAWIERYLEHDAAATVVCTAGSRSVRVDAAGRSSLHQQVAALFVS